MKSEELKKRAASKPLRKIKKRRKVKNKDGIGSKTEVVNSEIGSKTKVFNCEIGSKLENPTAELPSLEGVLSALLKAKQILVVVGAGISRSCGIPDFRSAQGIYKMVEDMDLALPEPECLFDLEYFKDDPTPFYKFAPILYSEKVIEPSLTHKFLFALEKIGKLLRVYTQNIDGLELTAGLKKVIQCHGSLKKAKCLKCKKVYPEDTVRSSVRSGIVPLCGKPKCSGVLKPSVTFFGEMIDSKVGKSLADDALKADLVLVMGTSMKVAPMSLVPSYVHGDVPKILINQEAVKLARGSPTFNFQLFGDCDAITMFLVKQLASRLNSQEKLRLDKALPAKFYRKISSLPTEDVEPGKLVFAEILREGGQTSTSMMNEAISQ